MKKTSSVMSSIMTNIQKCVDGYDEKKEKSKKQILRRMIATGALPPDATYDDLEELANKDLSVIEDAELDIEEMEEEAEAEDVALSENEISEVEYELDTLRTSTGRYGKGIPKKKKKVVMPAYEDSVLFKLKEYNLYDKLLEISLATEKVGFELKEDAILEIDFAWAKAKANPDFSEGELASYAYNIGRTTALKVRRDLGSACRLPGSAFRKKSDGSTYVTAGILAAPMDWDEMAEWLSTDDLGQGLESAYPFPDSVSKKISRRQDKIVQLLLAGESIEKIQAMLKIKKAQFKQDIKHIVSIMSARREDIKALQEQRQNDYNNALKK